MSDIEPFEIEDNTHNIIDDNLTLDVSDEDEEGSSLEELSESPLDEDDLSGKDLEDLSEIEEDEDPDLPPFDFTSSLQEEDELPQEDLPLQEELLQEDLPLQEEELEKEDLPEDDLPLREEELPQDDFDLGLDDIDDEEQAEVTFIKGIYYVNGSPYVFKDKPIHIDENDTEVLAEFLGKRMGDPVYEWNGETYKLHDGEIVEIASSTSRPSRTEVPGDNSLNHVVEIAPLQGEAMDTHVLLYIEPHETFSMFLQRCHLFDEVTASMKRLIAQDQVNIHSAMIVTNQLVNQAHSGYKYDDRDMQFMNAVRLDVISHRETSS